MKISYKFSFRDERIYIYLRCRGKCAHTHTHKHTIHKKHPIYFLYRCRPPYRRCTLLRIYKTLSRFRIMTLWVSTFLSPTFSLILYVYLLFSFCFSLFLVHSTRLRIGSQHTDRRERFRSKFLFLFFWYFDKRKSNSLSSSPWCSFRRSFLKLVL